MRKSEVIEHFGGVSKTASVLGISHPAVCRWVKSSPKTSIRHRTNYERQAEVRRQPLPKGYRFSCLKVTTKGKSIW